MDLPIHPYEIGSCFSKFLKRPSSEIKIGQVKSMKLNSTTVIVGNKVILVPYQEIHVLK